MFHLSLGKRATLPNPPHTQTNKQANKYRDIYTQTQINTRTQGHVETEDTKKGIYTNANTHTYTDTRAHRHTKTQKHKSTWTLSHKNKYIVHNPILYIPDFFNILEYFWEGIWEIFSLSSFCEKEVQLVDLQWEKLIKFLVKKETIQNFLVKVQSFYQGETRKKILLFFLTMQNKSNGEHTRYKIYPLNFAHQVSAFYFVQNMPLILFTLKFWYFLTAAGWHPDKEWTFIFIFGIFYCCAEGPFENFACACALFVFFSFEDLFTCEDFFCRYLKVPSSSKGIFLHQMWYCKFRSQDQIKNRSGEILSGFTEICFQYISLKDIGFSRQP